MKGASQAPALSVGDVVVDRGAVVVVDLVVVVGLVVAAVPPDPASEEPVAAVVVVVPPPFVEDEVLVVVVVVAYVAGATNGVGAAGPCSVVRLVEGPALRLVQPRGVPAWIARGGLALRLSGSGRPSTIVAGGARPPPSHGGPRR